MPRILLLDADALLARNLTRALNTAGHDVDWQVQPQEAITAVDAVRPEAIILDLLLGAKSAIEFLYELRSYPEWQSIPIIIFSGLPLAELGESADALQHLNIHAFYYKSQTTLTELIASLQQALQPAHAK